MYMLVIILVFPTGKTWATFFCMASIVHGCYLHTYSYWRTNESSPTRIRVKAPTTWRITVARDDIIVLSLSKLDLLFLSRLSLLIPPRALLVIQPIVDDVTVFHTCTSPPYALIASSDSDREHDFFRRLWKWRRVRAEHPGFCLWILCIRQQ